MDLEVGGVAAKPNMVASMASSIAEHVASLMSCCGIESISAERQMIGVRYIDRVSIACFPEAPEEAQTIGAAIKDDLAGILYVANINRLVVKPSADELLDLREAWADAEQKAKIANETSSGNT